MELCQPRSHCSTKILKSNFFFPSEPSSTQEDSEEYSETRSATEDSTSSAQECGGTTDPSDTQSHPLSEEPVELTKTENSDPVSSSSNGSADGDTSVEALTFNSFTELSEEGSSTAENNSQSPETAGDIE